jgi:hypothetical protein
MKLLRLTAQEIEREAGTKGPAKGDGGGEIKREAGTKGPAKGDGGGLQCEIDVKDEETRLMLLGAQLQDLAFN